MTDEQLADVTVGKIVPDSLGKIEPVPDAYTLVFDKYATVDHAAYAGDVLKAFVMRFEIEPQPTTDGGPPGAKRWYIPPHDKYDCGFFITPVACARDHWWRTMGNRDSLVTTSLRAPPRVTIIEADTFDTVRARRSIPFVGEATMARWCVVHEQEIGRDDAGKEIAGAYRYVVHAELRL